MSDRLIPTWDEGTGVSDRQIPTWDEGVGVSDHQILTWDGAEKVFFAPLSVFDLTTEEIFQSLTAINRGLHIHGHGGEKKF